MNLEKKLSFWIKNNYNVLFSGKKGIGKSSVIINAFEQAGLKWLYFSAATMDPWVDFVGIPKEMKDEKGNSYLDLVRPKVFQDDQVEAIFLDEFSRSSKKVRNAVMELIQFKSINGKKFNNLKIIWAAINPSDEEEKYDVEELDPAQQDRFHVVIELPYIPDAEYFKNKYGEDLATPALQWWKELDNKSKNKISPRRLDYALDFYIKGGDVRDVLPNSVNVFKFLTELEQGNFSSKLKELFENKNLPEAKDFLKKENNYVNCINIILNKQEFVNFFVPLLSEEKISSLFYSNKKIQELLLSNKDNFEKILVQIGNANTDKTLSRKVRDELGEWKARKDMNFRFNKELLVHYKEHSTEESFLENCKLVFKNNSPSKSSTNKRAANYHLLVDFLPEKLSYQSATLTFEVLCNIFNDSQVDKINKSYPCLIPMMNHVVSILNDNKVAPILGNYCIKKLKNFPAFNINATSSIPRKKWS